MLSVIERVDERTRGLFASMHLDRKRVFVDRLGWDVPHGPDGERDQFDGPCATYMVVSDAVGAQHLGSLRLLPTTRPHLLGSVFPHLCDGPVPRSESILEVTRLCVSPDLGKDQSLGVRRRLVGALVEYALLMGIEAYTMMTEVSLLSRVAALGWRCEMLGLPSPQGRDLIAALKVHVDTETIPLLRRKGVYLGPSIDRLETGIVATRGESAA